MTTTCEVVAVSGATPSIGDAVCLVGVNATTKLPKVSTALPGVLAGSKTVFGVAKTNTALGLVQVWVTGEVADAAATGFAPPSSGIVSIDDSAHLILMDRPNGSEFVVGTCDTSGNVAIQARASRDTGAVNVLHVDLFGAIADADFAGGGTPCATAFEAAIKALDPSMGGEVELSFTPGTAYRLERTVNVTRACKIKGQGGQLFFPGSAVIADEGVTAFRIWGQGGPDGDGGNDATFEDIAVLASGKSATTITGTYTANATSLPVDAPGDFVDGQLIAIEGVARQVTLAEVTAETTLGLPTVILTSSGDQTPPVVRVGQYLVVGTAYPTPTRVASVDDDDPLTLTMDAKAAGALTASPVKYCPPLIARIVSGSGTSTWTIDGVDGGDTSLASCVISHADSGFDLCNTFRMSRVTVGDALGHGFSGAAFTVRGSHANDPATNSNVSSLSNCTSYNNRHAVYVLGADANGCLFHVRSLQSVDWSFLELSLLGNTYSACHADGGLGYLSAEHPGNASLFFGCYAEGGTMVSLGSGSMSVGGTMPIFGGGLGIGRGLFNRATIGSPTLTRCTIYFEPKGNFFRVESNTGSGSLQFGTDTMVASPGVTGFLQWSHDSVFRHHPLVFANTDQAAFRAGTMWIPTDFWFGENPHNLNLDATVGARLASARSGTNGEGGVISDPVAGPYDADGTSTNNLPHWTKGDWIRDPNFLDGCPTRHVIEPGHRAPEWRPGTAYTTSTFVNPTVDKHTSKYFQNLGANGISHATAEPDWTTAPNPNDTLVDGTVTWTNTGDAAYTQPIELDGYIVHEISGNETFAQTDRVFLCGSIEIIGGLACDATITMPLGRYKRWIWNHTDNNHGLLVKCAAGNTVTIANGKAAEVQCTGVEMRWRTADVTP